MRKREGGWVNADIADKGGRGGWGIADSGWQRGGRGGGEMLTMADKDADIICEQPLNRKKAKHFSKICLEKMWHHSDINGFHVVLDSLQTATMTN